MPIHANARRCTHIKLNQKQCGAPALTAQPYCRFHSDLATRRRQNIVPVPILQTAADIQVAITDTIRALIEGRLDRLRASTILFGLQLAQNGLRLDNVSKVRFIGDLEDINPAERSVVMPALDDRQAQDEYEAELEHQLAREQHGELARDQHGELVRDQESELVHELNREQELSPSEQTRHTMGTVDEEELEGMVMELTHTKKAG